MSEFVKGQRVLMVKWGAIGVVGHVPAQGDPIQVDFDPPALVHCLTPDRQTRVIRPVSCGFLRADELEAVPS